MFKALFIFLLGMLVWKKADAQVGTKNDTLFYYVTDGGNVVSTKDSADYALYIMPRNTETKADLYQVNEYYLNGKPRLIATSRTHSLNLALDGPCIRFFPNGHRESIMNYKKGILDGNATEYYSNNIVHRTTTYKDGNIVGDASIFFPNGKLYSLKKFTSYSSAYVECRDSTGKILTTNGSGKWVEYDEDFKFAARQSTIKDGKMIITGEPIIDTAKDAYYNKTGEISLAVDISPSFPGGLEAFGRFISQNIKFPAPDREAGISGRVIIGFVVEKDGTLSNFHIIHSPSKTMSDEVVRLLQLSPIWKPGLQNSKPVRVNFTLPVSFALGEEKK
jgi:TonB family protein